jgi:hypothetical protein
MDERLPAGPGASPATKAAAAIGGLTVVVFPWEVLAG